jgi:hypothetical protein
MVLFPVFIDCHRHSHHHSHHQSHFLTPIITIDSVLKQHLEYKAEIDARENRSSVLHDLMMLFDDSVLSSYTSHILMMLFDLVSVFLTHTSINLITSTVLCKIDLWVWAWFAAVVWG